MNPPRQKKSKNDRPDSDDKLFPTREVPPEIVSQVIDLVIELNRDTLRELAKH